MLTEDGVLDRRSKYPCCVLGYLHRAVLAWDRGETHCGDENYEKALYMLWASRIMCSTPIDGDAHPGCTTMEEATEWASHADCLCSPCSCDEPVVDCTLVPDYTVLEGLAYSDLPPSPGVDDSYYILSGTNVGTIATVGSITYVFTSIPDDTIVFASDTNTYYTNIGNGPGLLFPPPVMTLVAGNVWVYASSNPGTASGRAIQLQGYTSANGWFNIATTTTEDALPQTVSITGLNIEEVRFVYLLEDGDCPEYSDDGTFVPPVVPPGPCDIVPGYAVIRTVDASEEGTQAITPGTYFIVTDTYNVGNNWAAHVGELVTTGLAVNDTYTVIADYTVVYDQTTDVNWWLTPTGAAPLFTPMTVEQVIGGYLLYSDFPIPTQSGTRLVTVEAMIDGEWTLFWAGYEYDLPQTVNILGPVTAIRTNYVYPSGCLYTVSGTVAPVTTVVTDTDCSEIVYNFPGYRYPQAGTTGFPVVSFLFTSVVPGQQVVLLFLQGGMGPGVVMRGYSGTDDTGDPIPALTGNFPNLTGAAGTSTGEYLYLEVEAPQAMTDDLATWFWQMSCATGAVPPTAIVTPTDDCANYEFSLDVDIDFLGDATSVGIQYSVDDAMPTTITGITTTGIQTIGPFAYAAQVEVILLHEQDPLANTWLGVFGNAGTCPDSANPCLPSGAFKIDDMGDLADLPDPAPFNGWLFLVLTDVTGLGTWPVGEMVVYSTGSGSYSPSSYTPGVITSTSNPTYWYSIGPGIQPFPLFPVQELAPTGNTPNNWSLFTPDIQNYAIPTNNPIQLEVRNGIGPWSVAWTGTLQQTIVQLPIPIVQPFTQARMIYDYATCGLISGVDILTEPST